MCTLCNVLDLIARWIWIKQLSKQDPSFIPTWLTQSATMRAPILKQNIADHYNFPLKKTKQRKQINKMEMYMLIPRLVTRSKCPKGNNFMLSS